MKITERLKKLLLVGALLLSVAGVYRLSPFFETVFSFEDSEVTEQRIFTLQKQVLHKKELDRQQQSLDHQLNKLEAGLLQGATYSLAAVNIQNLLYDLAQKYNVDIQSVRVLKTTKSDDERFSMYAIVSIQARMELSISQLKKILYDLAKSSNVLIVDALNIQVLKKGQTGKVTTTLTLNGLMLEQ